MKTRILIIFALFTFHVSPFTASAAAPAQIVVPVTFTYQGKSITAPMAVDTGASVTTIDSRLAARLGIPADCQHGGFAQMADGAAIRYCSETVGMKIGTLQRTQEINIMDYSANRDAEGMLGLDVLSTGTLTLDWRKKRIYWSE